MSSQINPSSINAQFPVPGVNQPSQGFRTNFLAIQNNFSEAVSELNDLTSKVIVSAPLLYGPANVSINNFGGMQNANLSLLDYALVVSNIVATAANSVPTLNFSNTSVANINITAGASAIQSIAFSNFPGLGYSEMTIIAQATNVPQYLNFSNLTIGSTIYGGNGVTGFFSANNTVVLNTTQPKLLKFGSADGTNWFVSGIN